MDFPDDPIRYPQQDNPWWPLPPTYQELTARGKQAARLNALALKETPDDCMAGWSFFRTYYLHPSTKCGWYKQPYYPSPPIHYELVKDVHRYPRNLYGTPRSFAKTILTLEIILFWLITRPGFVALLLNSVIQLVRRNVHRIKRQLEQNPRFLEDFGPLKTPRGSGGWSNEWLTLSNGSELMGRPAGGQLLGPRPDYWFMDDIEYDPTIRASSSGLQAAEKLTQVVIEMVSNHLEPMLDERCGALITGTLLHRKSFLYRMGKGNPEDNPRLQYWNRVIIGARDPSGSLTWREKFSEERLQERRESLGLSAYLAQVENNPGSPEDRIFTLVEPFGYYEGSHEPDGILTAWTTRTLEKPRQVSRPFQEALSQMRRVTLVDYAPTYTPLSDFNCVMVLGIENSPDFPETIWVLDLWLKRAPEPELYQAIWDLSEKWQVDLVGVEAVTVQKQFADRVTGVFLRKFPKGVNHQWRPRIFPITYEGATKMSKGQRLLWLEWRFNHNKIKLPGGNQRSLWPWRELESQIHNFSVDLSLLSYDDAIDTLGMVQFIHRTTHEISPLTEHPSNLIEAYETGTAEYIPGTKTPIPEIVPPQVWTQRFWKRYNQRMNRRRSSQRPSRTSVCSPKV